MSKMFSSTILLAMKKALIPWVIPFEGLVGWLYWNNNNNNKKALKMLRF